MNDELILNSYLLLLKSTVEVYVHGTLEASNPNVRSTLKKDLSDTMQHQADTYDLMTKYGWYKVNNVKSSDIKKVINKVQNSN